MSERDAVEMLLDWFPAGHPAIDELIGVRAACARLKKWNDEAKADIERLRALLHELADDLESELLGRYKTLEGKMHPVEQRRFERDMDSVRRARRALERRKE